jgi:hypothetical protein
MASELVATGQRRWRREIPDKHRASLDTRVVWLWNQRFGVVQTVYNESPDVLDKTAATLILQAIMARDLVSIRQVFQRLEGGSQFDDEVIEAQGSLRI